MRPILLAAVLCLGAASLAGAEDAKPAVGGDAMPGMRMESGESPFEAVMAKMHAAMMVPPTGDVDVDFVRGMIPHHQSAIDMARIELEKGSDPEIRAMAEAIIAAQENEIAEMQAWLAAHGG